MAEKNSGASIDIDNPLGYSLQWCPQRHRADPSHGPHHESHLLPLRHTSMHAAGVVISQKPMDEYVPLSRGADGMITTQFPMTTIEELGLLKMDFLGLRTTVVGNGSLAVFPPDIGRDKIHGAGAVQGDSCNNILKMNPELKKLYEGDESVKELIDMSRRLEGLPRHTSMHAAGGFNSLIKFFIPALSSWNTPSVFPVPREFKTALSSKSMLSISMCPQLEPILSPTYGCIVYQEQVMQIVRDLGGYTMGRSDLVRRAMSKKKAYVKSLRLLYGPCWFRSPTMPSITGRPTLLIAVRA